MENYDFLSREENLIQKLALEDAEAILQNENQKNKFFSSDSSLDEQLIRGKNDEKERDQKNAKGEEN